MPNALLSIVTPVLNGARFLPEAIGAVAKAAKLGVPIEHVIVDGGSSDATVEIARFAKSQPGSPITHMLTGPDTGQANAINRGVAVSSGTFVGWLNADDVVVPEGIVQLAQIMRGTHADVVLGRCRFVDQAGRTVFAPVPPDPVTPESLLRLLSGWFAGRSIVQPEAFVRREIFESLGGVDESLHYTMDHHLWVRLASAGARFQAEEIEVARQLVHPGQKTADNIAVAREMLSYAKDMLAGRPRSDQHAQAIREIDRVATRVRRASQMVSVLDHVLGMETIADTVVAHGQYGSVPEELLREWSRSIRRHHSILIAGIDPKDRERILRHCKTLLPPVVVGRLPEVTAQFDLVVTTRAGLDGLPARADVTRLLRPGGSLCVLGATPGSRYRHELHALRRAIADRVTFNAQTFLDEPVSKEILGDLHGLGQARAIRLPTRKRVRFLPDSAAAPNGLAEIAQRLQGRIALALSGITIVNL